MPAVISFGPSPPVTSVDVDPFCVGEAAYASLHFSMTDVTSVTIDQALISSSVSTPEGGDFYGMHVLAARESKGGC